MVSTTILLLCGLAAAIPAPRPSDVPTINQPASSLVDIGVDEGGIDNRWIMSFDFDDESAQASGSEDNAATDNRQAEETPQDTLETSAVVLEGVTPGTVQAKTKAQQTEPKAEEQVPNAMTIEPPQSRKITRPGVTVDAGRRKLEELTKQWEDLLQEYVTPNFEDDAWIKRSKLRRQSLKVRAEILAEMKELGAIVGIAVSEYGKEEAEKSTDQPEWQSTKITSGLRDTVHLALKKAAESIRMDKKLPQSCDKIQVTRTSQDLHGGELKTETVREVVNYDEKRKRMLQRLKNLMDLEKILSFRGKEPDLGPGKNKPWTRSWLKHEIARKGVASFFRNEGKEDMTTTELENLDDIAALSNMWGFAAIGEITLLGERRGKKLKEWVEKVDEQRERFFKACEKPGTADRLGWDDVLQYELSTYEEDAPSESENGKAVSSSEGEEGPEPDSPEVDPGVNAKLDELNKIFKKQRELPPNPLGDIIKVVEKIQNYWIEDKKPE